MGVASAVFAAVDGGARLWEPDGFWRSAATRRYYRVRPALRAAAWAFAGSLSVVLLPRARPGGRPARLPAGLPVRVSPACRRRRAASRAYTVGRRDGVRPGLPARRASARVPGVARAGGRDARRAGARRAGRGPRAAPRRGAGLVADRRGPADVGGSRAGGRSGASGSSWAARPARGGRDRSTSAARTRNCCGTTSGSRASGSCSSRSTTSTCAATSSSRCSASGIAATSSGPSDGARRRSSAGRGVRPVRRRAGTDCSTPCWRASASRSPPTCR